MDRYNVICTMISLGDVSMVRVCAQFYNTIEDYRRLGEAILELKAEEW